MQYKPGLVGGHCIGVDPYYLTHKALEVGHNPEMILAGRRINDNMGLFVVGEVLDLMRKKNINIENANILIMGLAFKENCPDIRNTRVIDLVKKFKPYLFSNSVDLEFHYKYSNKVNHLRAEKFDGKTNIGFRKKMASKVFKKISNYDKLIFKWFNE